MKIIVVSDNHGDYTSLLKIREAHSDADLFVHCGDALCDEEFLEGYLSVNGNNDYSLDFPYERIIDIEGFKTLVLHGHPYLSFYGKQRLIDHAYAKGCSLVLFGHTHVFEWDIVNQVHFINPGSLSHNRDGTLPSYAIIEIENGILSVERKDYISSCKVV